MIDKVIYVCTAECGRDGLVDIRHADTQSLGFLLINIQFELRRILQSVWTHTFQQFRVFFNHTQQLVTCFCQFSMTQVSLVDKLKVKPCRRTQFDNRGQVEGENHPIFNLAESFGCAANNGSHAVFSSRTLIPRFEAYKGDTGVLPLTAKAKPVNRKD
ncbi:hypothetical protein D3C76_1085050 [compost metagenome]